MSHCEHGFEEIGAHIRCPECERDENIGDLHDEIRRMGEMLQRCYHYLCAEFHRDYPLAFEIREAFPWVARYDNEEER